MATQITMPSLGQSMEEGTIVRWMKAEGDPVSEGEPLYEVLTDKVSIEVPARISGTLRKILAGVDSIVPVGDPVAIIGSPTESLDAAEGVAGPSSKPASATSEFSGSAARVAESAAPIKTGRERVNASPLARRLAAERGVDLSRLAGRGTGPQGRIVKADVLSHCDTESTAKAVVVGPATASAPESRSDDGSNGEYTEIPFAGMRKMVADAMVRSAANPHLTVTMAVDMTEATVLRRKLLPEIEKTHQARLSYTDIIAMVTARALVEHKHINSALIEDRIRRYDVVHLGIAVSLGTNGLIVPVVRNAHAKGLGAISAEIKELAVRAREGKLASDEVTGGTFTVSNLGPYGVATFDPIINPPQSAILGVCAIVDTVVPVDGAPAIRPMMNLCLTFDHRIIDGAPAAAFLARVKSILENPALLIA
jgi:pyruvate dehydrogenase E2 component (dihydrolipoamide acetyltransferase)